MPEHHFGRELWERMRAFVEKPDGLDEYVCGMWTIDKLFFLCQYLAQTTQAMVGNKKFAAINYIDLFAGSGVCKVESDGRWRRYPGSALLAAGCKKAFDNIFVVEKDKIKINDLKERMEKLETTSQIYSWSGDVNELMSEVIEAIPDRSLNVAFVDPYSLDIHYDSIRLLAEKRPLDLIILFADSMDIVRNVEAYYYPKISNKLDLFLGKSCEWRNRWDSLENRNGGNVRELFAKIYLEQLGELGYENTAMKIISTSRGPLYRLIYASKHSLGLKFWEIAALEDRGGNRSLWGI